MTVFRPMLAGKADLQTLRWPVLASAKIDGLRVTIRDGVPYSRSQKPLPNLHLQECVRRMGPLANTLDGEVVVGDVRDPAVYRRSMSEIMSVHGQPAFGILVFDRVAPGPYLLRAQDAGERIRAMLRGVWPEAPIEMLPQERIHSRAELDAYEERIVQEGYEGVMLRDPASLYKQGRASSRTQELLKLKRYEDGEAIVVGVEEEMHNANVAVISETGYTKRSSHGANQHGKGRLGALVVRGVTVCPGVEFRVGSGFTAADRERLWGDPPIGLTVRVKYFATGSKDAPRFPIFQGFRDPADMGPAHPASEERAAQSRLDL